MCFGKGTFFPFNQFNKILRNVWNNNLDTLFQLFTAIFGESVINRMDSVHRGSSHTHE